LSIWGRRRLRKDFSTVEDTTSLLARLILVQALKETGIREEGVLLTAPNQLTPMMTPTMLPKEIVEYAVQRLLIGPRQ
jgi:hypothetical protein